jgi:hypothetical protein
MLRRAAWDFNARRGCARFMMRHAIASTAEKIRYNLRGLEGINPRLQQFIAQRHQVGRRELLDVGPVIFTVLCMAHDRPLLLSARSPRPLLVRTQSGLFELQRSLNLMQCGE